MRRQILALGISTALGIQTAQCLQKAQVSSLKPEELAEYGSLSKELQVLLRYGLELTTENLRYEYGSNDPGSGGMDCSGTVSHILNHAGYPAPRMAHLIYLWAKEAGTLIPVKNCHSLNDSQLSRLRPGDLLFWEGTYDTGERNPPISHVMIFLGHEKSNGRAVMVGASSGRYYAGRPRHGVSVFDFALPLPKANSKFVAYARVPGITPKAAEPSGPGQVAAVPRPKTSTPDPKVVATPTPSPAVDSATPEAPSPPDSAQRAKPRHTTELSVKSVLRRLLR